MQRFILRVFAIMALCVVCSGCNYIALGQPPGERSTKAQFSAMIVQPTPPAVLVSGEPAFIIVEVPISGVLLPGAQFFSAFTNANPQLLLACPGVVTVGAGRLSTFGGAGTPAISMPITPAAPGSCSVPFNLGQNGTVQFPIVVPPPTPSAH